MSFYKDLVKKLNKDNTVLLSEGGNSAEFSGWIDTGSYALNALVSGSLYGGIPNNKITALAGEEATGKTFFALGLIDSFMTQNKEAGVNFNDTESAVTKEMMLSRGIDPERLILSEPATVQEFRTSALNFIDSYLEFKKPPPVMMVLDSLGQLSTSKEVEDTGAGKETKDMSRAALIKGMFRVLNLKLAKAKIPMLVTNHVYDVVGCLDSSQRILMADETFKFISDVIIGDIVMTLNGPKEVTDLFQYDVTELQEITLEDGKVIKATPNHKFLLSSGEWKRADELSEDDDLALFSK